ncbi:hypothetical protein PoB_006320300, partial [Plakobranchus ocellatus]
ENGSDCEVSQHLPQILLFDSNFVFGAHWMEERQTEEKGIDNTQKQAETFGRTNFVFGAHWMEERQTEEKGIDNTQKQEETFGRTNHSNFFPGAHWVEERLTEEKRLNNTQKQAQTFGVTQTGADWRTAHPGCALQTFDSKGARQAGF